MKTRRSDLIVSGVQMTSYELTVTKKGNEALLVTYHTKFEDVKQWLFLGSRESLAWWSERTTIAMPAGASEALSLCTKGKLKPTAEVHFVRDGRWPVVKKTVVGQYPEEFWKWMKEAREVFGGVEVVRVRC